MPNTHTIPQLKYAQSFTMYEIATIYWQVRDGDRDNSEPSNPIVVPLFYCILCSLNLIARLR